MSSSHNVTQRIDSAPDSLTSGKEDDPCHSCVSIYYTYLQFVTYHEDDIMSFLSVLSLHILKLYV
jgi:hypothetical protein